MTPRAPSPTLEFEKKYGYPRALIAGVDEVGRGCLAGPVVTCALILPKEVLFEGWVKDIADSKFLNAPTRSRLKIEIEKWALCWSIGSASVEEIDQINIYHASLLAMKRAIDGLSCKPHHVLVDGNALPKELSVPATAVVKGDQKCLSISAASILAKVYRDELMCVLDGKFSGYGFAAHKGYATLQHRKAIQQLGVCGIHRQSFNTDFA